VRGEAEVSETGEQDSSANCGFHKGYLSGGAVPSDHCIGHHVSELSIRLSIPSGGLPIVDDRNKNLQFGLRSEIAV
jgi:hypothetical protein